MAMSVSGGLAVRDVPAGQHDAHVKAYRSRRWARNLKRRFAPLDAEPRGGRFRSVVCWTESERFMCVANDGCSRTRVVLE